MGEGFPGQVKMKKIIFFFWFLSITRLVSSQDVSQKFQGFNLQGYDKSGNKTWDVNGETADILDTQVEMTNVDANAYGDQEVNIKARKGTIDKLSGNMVLKDDVVITTDQGDTLTTEELNWERTKDLVYTEEDVLIVNDRMTTTGKGALVHPNQKTAILKEDVTVKVKTEPKKSDSKIMTITCDGPMEFDQVKRELTFNNNVVAEQEGRQLKADKMVIYMDEGMKQLKEMVCTGHVLVSQGENQSYSEKAVYRAADQKMILSGSPKLRIITEGEGSIQSLNKLAQEE